MLLPIELQKVCEDYGGIAHIRQWTCCASTCGMCGGPGCSEAPGGNENCCNSGIPSENICGAAGQMAPCHLGKNNLIYVDIYFSNFTRIA